MKTHYNDKIIILGLLPIISIFTTIVGTDYDLPYLFSWAYIEQLIYTFVEVLTIWSFLRFSIVILDKRMPFNKENAQKRFFLQVLFTLIIYIIFRFLFTYVEIIFFERPFDVKAYIHSDLPMEITFIILVNIIYAYWSQVGYQEKMKEEQPASLIMRALKPKPNFIEIKKNKKTIYLDSTKIAYIYRANTITYLKTIENAVHIIDFSLTDLQELLGHENYFRVNRQFLVNQSAIQAYKILPNRQIQISLLPSSDIDCKLNKNNFKNFKDWLLQQNRVIKPS